MILQDLLNFSALLAAGIVGALIFDPLRGAVKLAAERVRTPNRNRR